MDSHDNRTIKLTTPITDVRRAQAKDQFGNLLTVREVVIDCLLFQSPELTTSQEEKYWAYELIEQCRLAESTVDLSSEDRQYIIDRLYIKHDVYVYGQIYKLLEGA